MAKLLKVRKKQSLNLLGYATMIFTFAIIISLATRIFVHSDTARTVREIEKHKIVREKLNANNVKLAREVNQMGDYANIVEKAEEFGLAHYVDNSYFVSKGD